MDEADYFFVGIILGLVILGAAILAANPVGIGEKEGECTQLCECHNSTKYEYKDGRCICVKDRIQIYEIK